MEEIPMSNLKDIETLETLSLDEMKQVAGGRGCYKPYGRFFGKFNGKIKFFLSKDMPKDMPKDMADTMLPFIPGDMPGDQNPDLVIAGQDPTFT